MATLPATSRAAVLHDYKGKFTVEDVAMPKVLEPGSIMTEMDCATICGSDVHIWQGEIAAPPGVNIFPLILGHEMVGRVHTMGAGVETDSVGQPLKRGDRVVWTLASCGRCYECTILKEPTLCYNRIASVLFPITRYPHVCGTFSQYSYIFPGSGRVKVPDEVPSEWAAASSCAFRTVVHAFERLGALSPYDTVVIQGAGPLGLFSLALAVQAGVAETIVIGAPAARLEVAKRWGASHVVSIDEYPDAAKRVAHVRQLTGGRGAHVVVEVSGGRTAFAEGLEMARKNGRYLVVGQTNPGQLPIAPRIIVNSQLTVIGCMSGFTEHYWRALEFLKRYQDRFPFADMISRRYPLEKTNEAMTAMKEFREVKAVITFGA